VNEPFEIATTRSQSGGLQPLLEALAKPGVRSRVQDLGGYDLSRAGDMAPA
jgi:hypothetical protein